MDTSEGQVNIPKNLPKWLGIALLVAIFAVWLVIASPSASLAASSYGIMQITETSTFTVTLTSTQTSTPTNTPTDTPVSTSTHTPTDTLVSTSTSTTTRTPTATPTAPKSNLPLIFKQFPLFTLTPTATVTTSTTPPNTATLTPTETVTRTGTPPTPTRTPTGPTPTISTTPTPTLTGTITPNIVITASATPTEVRPTQTINFQFAISNRGLAPATNVSFLDSLPGFLDISSVTTTKGSKSPPDQHSVTVYIGTLNVNETVTININAKVNASAVTGTQTNTGFVTYDVNKSASKSVSYRVVGSGLPGTGELPIEPQERAGPDLSLLFLSITFGLGAIFALWYGFWARANKLAGVKWYFGIGLVLISTALVAGLAGSRILQPGRLEQAAPIAQADTDTPVIGEHPTPETLAGFEIAPAFEPAAQAGMLPIYRHATVEPLDTLPSYPIPTPTIIAAPGVVTETLDTSPVVRLVIPTLEVDNEVKYVPWDSELETWLIAGLRQEIAWLGGTSWPGLGSNTVLAGHVTVRDYGNGPFRYLDKLVAGDEITLFTSEKTYTYRVRETTVVAEGDLWVTDPTENPQLTLITCTDWSRDYQMYLRRLIIFADLVRSDPIQASTGY